MALQFVEAPDHRLLPERVSLGAYGDVLRLYLENTDLAAGNNLIEATAVPAGKIHVYTDIVIEYLGVFANVAINAHIKSGGDYFFLFFERLTASGVPYDRQGLFALQEGEQLGIGIVGATLHDNAYLWATGYSVDLV